MRDVAIEERMDANLRTITGGKTMAASSGGIEGKKGLLRPRNAILLVLVVLFAAFYVITPTRYFFKESGGKLSLRIGKCPWLGGSYSKALEPFEVGTADFGPLLDQRFETEAEAVAALREFCFPRIQENEERAAALEKELKTAYGALLGYLGAARSLGAEGLDEDISGVKAWLEFYEGREKRRAEGELPFILLPTEIPTTTAQEAAEAAVPAKPEAKAALTTEGGQAAEPVGHGEPHAESTR